MPQMNKYRTEMKQLSLSSIRMNSQLFYETLGKLVRIKTSCKKSIFGVINSRS